MCCYCFSYRGNFDSYLVRVFCHCPCAAALLLNSFSIFIEIKKVCLSCRYSVNLTLPGGGVRPVDEHLNTSIHCTNNLSFFVLQVESGLQHVGDSLWRHCSLILFEAMYGNEPKGPPSTDLSPRSGPTSHIHRSGTGVRRRPPPERRQVDRLRSTNSGR